MKHNEMDQSPEGRTGAPSRCEQSGAQHPVERTGLLRSNLWKIIVVAAIAWGLFSIPKRGYDIYAKKAALLEILEFAKPLQEYYSAHGKFPIIPDEVDIDLKGQYQASPNDDGVGGVQFDWSIALVESKIMIELGPGFADNKRYTIILISIDKEGGTNWECSGGTLPDSFRVAKCRSP